MRIYFAEFNFSVYPKKIPDTIIKKLNDTVSVKVFLKSDKGAAILYTFDLQKKILIKGEYADALDVFKGYVVKYDKDANRKYSSGARMKRKSKSAGFSCL